VRKNWHSHRNNRPICRSDVEKSCPYTAINMRAAQTWPNRTLRRLRLELGMSQDQYAEAVGATPRQVRNWEGGRVTCPQTWYLVRMHGLHGTTAPEDLGFTRRKSRLARTGTATVKGTDHAEASVFRRDLLGLVAAALSGSPVPALAGLLSPSQEVGSIGMPDVKRVQQTNIALYGADLLIGGAAVAQNTLLGQFSKAASLLHGQYSHVATRMQMHSAVSHLGSTIGFMLFDQGQHLRARQVYAASLRVANSASDRWPLRAIIFSEMARQCRHLGALKEADELIMMAHGADAEVTPTCRAMLHALTATIWAAGGDRTQTTRYIRMAEDEFAHASPANDPSWISWFDTAELRGETGNALALLAHHHEELRDDALDRLSTSAISHGPAEQRSTALALTRLAGIHAVRQDPSDAAQAAQHALDITARLRSPRVIDELNALRPALQPLTGHDEVAAIDRTIASLPRSRMA
jgi:transcriptional regulator with XRE-family HTH domain